MSPEGIPRARGTGIDVLVLAAHPDDAELCCGGTILELVEGGRQVVLVDMTRGEKGTLGTVETRQAECEAATHMLGVEKRVNLGLPDVGLRDDEQGLAAVVGVLRQFRPRLLLAPHPRDIHPDHEATGLLAHRAYFVSGLRNYEPELGEAHRPSLLLSYGGNDLVEPSFCLDISAHEEKKLRVIECYATQVGHGEMQHFARGLDPLSRVRARDSYFGALIGCRAAEPFSKDGPLPLENLSCLLGRGQP